MKKAILITIAVLALGSLFYWYRVASASVGNLNIISGSATVQRSKKEMPGNTGLSIKATDVIKVDGSSRVSIILKDGSVIRLEAGSVMEIEGDGTFRLISGKMWSKVQPLAANSKWEVETPTIVAAVRGTQFNTRYSDASSGVSVYKGTVGVGLLENRTEQKLLQKNNQFILGDATLQEDFAKDPTIMDPSSYDDWILFNLGEDAKLDNENYIAPEKPEATTTIPVKTETKNTSPPIATPTPKPTPTPVVPQKKLLAVSIYGNKSIILVNEETKVKASAKYSDNSTYEIPYDQIKWTYNANLGHLTAPGYYSSARPTSIELRAEFEGVVSGPVTITVKDTLRVLKRIEISYVKNTSQSQTYYEYPTAQFTATAVYDDNTTKDVTSSASWSIESGTAGGSISSNGLYVPETRGDALIKAVFEAKSVSQSISIP